MAITTDPTVIEVGVATVEVRSMSGSKNGIGGNGSSRGLKRGCEGVEAPRKGDIPGCAAGGSMSGVSSPVRAGPWEAARLVQTSALGARC